jgi:hypothetical protein
MQRLGEPSVDGMAQPPLHDLAVREPRLATRLVRSVRRRLLALGAAALAAALGVPAGAQPSLVDPAASEIRTYRLTIDNVRKLERVTQALDRYVPPARDATRPDVMTFVVLSMSIPHRVPIKDSTVDDLVRDVDSGHQELAQAIQAAGLSTRDYVLTQLTLLLSYPVVHQKRQGRTVSTTDVSADSLAVVEANWREVDRFMQAFAQRVNAERKRQGGG